MRRVLCVKTLNNHNRRNIHCKNKAADWILTGSIRKPYGDIIFVIRTLLQNRFEMRATTQWAYSLTKRLMVTTGHK